jgi:hypothetical protein
MGRKHSWALVFSLIGGLFASTAYADATVKVELKAKDGSLVDGRVELVKGDVRKGCTTQAGRCEIQGVPGGMYTVEVSVPGKPSPKPKQVMIPPSGDAKLVVSAS